MAKKDPTTPKKNTSASTKSQDPKALAELSPATVGADGDVEMKTDAPDASGELTNLVIAGLLHPISSYNPTNAILQI